LIFAAYLFEVMIGEFFGLPKMSVSVIVHKYLFVSQQECIGVGQLISACVTSTESSH